MDRKYLIGANQAWLIDYLEVKNKVETYGKTPCTENTQYILERGKLVLIKESVSTANYM